MNRLTCYGSRIVGGQPSRWWPSGKSLGPRGLLPLWS